jgi:two-component system sensor histidine kinase BaeS
MTSWRRAARLLNPRSIRARIALVIVAAMLVSGAGVLWAFQSTVESATRDDIERALGQQATAIARTIDDAGTRDAARSAREARRFIGDLRMVVSVSGEVVYFSAGELDADARAEGTSGAVTVLLERPDAQARAVGPWGLLAFVLAALLFVSAVVWYLSGTIARRLRRSVGEVADSAEAVTRGHFDVRVPESDDELGRLAHAFNRMTERLEAADARQREFLADVAHELRTPVTAIEGFATALVDGTARSDDDRREAAEFIRSEAARMSDLVSDLHTLTWLDLDPPAAAEPVDLAASARTALTRAAPAARGTGVALHGPEGTCMARADTTHIDTILDNLIANALAATPAGGSITLRTVSRHDRVGVAVTDTGRGIGPEHLPHVFERLYRADSSRSRGPAGGGGSGLGLPIVRRLAALQGGTVDVRSTPGEGSTFTVWLPAAR